MNIENAAPTAAELALLYRDAGWIEHPELDRMQQAVESGSEWFVARHNETLLGAGRIISDGVRYAFIVDVIVLEAHQAKGIGTALMEAILARCKDSGVDSVNLWPSKGKVAFYERFGFYALPGEQPHMKLRNE